MSLPDGTIFSRESEGKSGDWKRKRSERKINGLLVDRNERKSGVSPEKRERGQFRK